MNMYFCGGAGEVGASCILLNIDGRNLVLDCGVRMGPSGDQLPDLRMIQEHGGVDAILVSHAHMDHSGSLPVLSREYPGAKIYMTHATKDLIRVLLYDSLKIMEGREQEIPIFAEVHVRHMLDRVLCYTPEYPFSPFNDDLKVTFYSAGHIAGAASIYITGKEASVFYSGDFSTTRQRTVEGASIPRLRPDVAILESTYGDRLHSDRKAEEDRLVERVREVVTSGKKILIPAFALGRAQEIILILKSAMNRGKLPAVRIYVDGMVNDVCRIYRLNPNYLREQLARKIFRGDDIFYDDNIVAVVKKQHVREEIISRSEGCCIIASSGMLTGGPSQWYAEKLAGDEGNYIALTGYQDEESPGRQLLELADMPVGDDRQLKLGDRSFPVRCGIGKYGLSAHADKTEIISLAHALGARRVFFVHGDQEVTTALARELQKEYGGWVFSPANGENYAIDVKKPRKQLEKSAVPSLGKGGLPVEDNIKELWEFILNSSGTGRGFTVEELLYSWSGNTGFSEDEIAGFSRIISTSAYFEPETRRPFIFHAAGREKMAGTGQDGTMEINKMLALVDSYFPPETGLYKKGARQDEKVVLLYFNFPLTAVEKCKEKILEFEAATGWKVSTNTDCNLSAAENLIHKLLPPGANAAGISYFRNNNLFKVKVGQPLEDSLEVSSKFREITGLDLQFEYPGMPGAETNTPVKALEHQMEQNQALGIIQEAFAGREDRLYRKSLKTVGGQPTIELTFISPAIGEKYRQLIAELEACTRWPITINQTPNQNEILNIGRRILEKHCIALRRNLAYLPKEMEVLAYVQAGDEKSLREAAAEFEKVTGIRIRFE